MERPYFIEHDQPDELVVNLCRIVDAIREAMDTSQRRQQSNVTAELAMRLRQFADLIDRLPPAD
ncbi:hypothetical protein [Hyphomicrobium facile]|uniref:Uncharacterized protein n=1 Tax=Hyphomicrobium facile TaxID=51670 RepID=A0A1I7MTL9_9HYPH|nr:hypothetical protein [Hyphomicrobium facile]SFV25745.1 hypothetical protein SAMN04488557_0084 [Hyphomicrobium facile]